MTEWTPVFEKMPDLIDSGLWYEYTSTVLVYAQHECKLAYATRYYDDGERDWEPWRWKLAGPEGYDIDGITHWMPLPAPPEA